MKKVSNPLRPIFYLSPMPKNNVEITVKSTREYIGSPNKPNPAPNKVFFPLLVVIPLQFFIEPMILQDCL